MHGERLKHGWETGASAARAWRKAQARPLDKVGKRSYGQRWAQALSKDPGAMIKMKKQRTAKHDYVWRCSGQSLNANLRTCLI